MRCLTAGRMNMRFTLLHQNASDGAQEDINLELYGDWVQRQDPLTHEIVQIWEAFTVPKPTDANPDMRIIAELRCIARGIVDGGIRVAGTTERFGDSYENIDFVKMWIPPNVRISKRDRVTNIKDATGHIRWLDEEFGPDVDGLPRATVFNVNGVTPLFDAFNRISEQFVLLERVV